jgi:hypothetical protein
MEHNSHLPHSWNSPLGKLPYFYKARVRKRRKENAESQSFSGNAAANSYSPTQNERADLERPKQQRSEC